MLRFFQQLVGSTARSSFTIPSGYPRAGSAVVARVNGVDSAYTWGSATTINLRTAARPGSIVDFFNVDSPVAGGLVWTGSLDFPSIAPAATASLTASVPGAELGDLVTFGLPSNAPIGLVYQPLVTAANVVTVRATNVTAAAIDPPVGAFRIRVSKA